MYKFFVFTRYKASYVYLPLFLFFFLQPPADSIFPPSSAASAVKLVRFLFVILMPVACYSAARVVLVFGISGAPGGTDHLEFD